jgi:hypothetical protein
VVGPELWVAITAVMMSILMGGYRAELVTGSVPGSRRWMSIQNILDLESY